MDQKSSTRLVHSTNQTGVQPESGGERRKGSQGLQRSAGEQENHGESAGACQEESHEARVCSSCKNH